MKNYILPAGPMFVVSLCFAILLGVQYAGLLVFDPDDDVWTGACTVTGSEVADGEATMALKCDGVDIRITDSETIVAYMNSKNRPQCTRRVSRTLKRVSYNCAE